MGKDIKSALKDAEKQGDFYNDYAIEVAERTFQMRPSPVLQIGGTGWGKTKLARLISRIADLDFIGVNAYPGMDISQVIGMWRPSNVNNHIEVVWEDGLLTQAVRKGALFALEEITRLPRKMQGRLLGILDSENRYFSLPEAGIDNVDINDNFWLIATANPTGEGYDTTALDKALARRFGAIFNVDQPLCDEKRKFVYELSKYFDEEFANDRAERILKWLSDCRGWESGKGNINTGEVVQLIRNSKHAPLKEACAWTISPKYPKDSKEIMIALDAHTDTEDDWEKHVIDTPDTLSVPKQEEFVPPPSTAERQEMVKTASSDNEDLTSLLAKLVQGKDS